MGGLREPLSHIVGVNSEEFNYGDLVTFASGFLSVVDHATSDRIDGICKIKKTMESDNQTVDEYEVPYIPLSVDDLFEMDLDADATSAVQGQFFTITTGGTGDQDVSFSSASATVGQVCLVKLDPRGTGSVRRGLFRVALNRVAFEPET